MLAPACRSTPRCWRGSGGPDASPLRSAEEWQGELAAAGFATSGSTAVATGPWPSYAVWGRVGAMPSTLSQSPTVPRARVRLIASGGTGAASLAAHLAALGH